MKYKVKLYILKNSLPDRYSLAIYLMQFVMYLPNPLPQGPLNCLDRERFNVPKSPLIVSLIRYLFYYNCLDDLGPGVFG